MTAKDTDIAAAGLLYSVAAALPDVNLPRLPDWIPPESELQQELARAARLAAGVEESAGEPQPLGEDPRRVSIFSKVRFDGDWQAGEERYVPLRELGLREDVLFPTGRSAANAENGAGALRGALNDGLKALGESDLSPAAYLRALDDVVRRTCWCLPAPAFDGGQGGETGVSLYDHARLVAALLPALRAEADGERVATLVFGDVSGVQDFIYTITSRGAASGLRGRSVYLQLLTEAIAAFVARELRVPPTALIFAGGGHFLLVARPDAADRLDDIQAKVSEKLLTHHRGELFLALGHHGFTESDFAPDKFGEAWKQLKESAGRAKRRRFAELADGFLMKKLFDPQGAGGDKEMECRVCHYAAVDKADLKDTKREDEDGDKIYLCKLCHSLQDDLGRKMRDPAGLWLAAVDEAEDPAHRATYDEVLKVFGLDVKIVEKGEAAPAPPDDDQGDARVWALSDDAFEDLQASTNGDVPILLHYMVNVAPRANGEDVKFYEEVYPPADDEEEESEAPEPGDVKPFELLQAQAVGIRRLGVLRMDVDDLGQIFARGFGDGQSSLSRTAALSLAMTLFFEGWVESLARAANETNLERAPGPVKKPPEDDGRPSRDVVYSIYSGGDDLFIVGAWDVLPELARDVNRDLGRYAAGNPAVHASAGITLHGGKYPLYQMAQDAAEALEAAKAYENGDGRGGGKNAFTFLGRTRPWADFTAVFEAFSLLVDLVERPEVPHSLLRQIHRLDMLYMEHKQEQIERGQDPQQVFWGPWHWQSAHQLTTLARQLEQHHEPVSAEAIKKIRDGLGKENFRRIELWGISTRWADLFVRESNVSWSTNDE